MHEVLLLGIAASELTVLLTSDPRRWSRRLSLFLTFLLAVICYSWFVLGVSAVANAIGATLAVVWFAWDLVDPSARGVLARWALASVGALYRPDYRSALPRHGSRQSPDHGDPAVRARPRLHPCSRVD